MVTGLLNTGDGETSNILLDLLGFDGWPACYAMQQVAAGEPEKKMVWCFVVLVFCVWDVLLNLFGRFPFGKLGLFIF